MSLTGPKVMMAVVPPAISLRRGERALRSRRPGGRCTRSSRRSGGADTASNTALAARRLRFARKRLSDRFPYLPQQSGYNKRL